MARKPRTTTFIHQLPLRATPAQAARLDRILEAQRQLYNAVLGEGLRRLARLRASEAFRIARAMPTETTVERTARAKAFATLNKTYGFTDAALQHLATGHKNACWFADVLHAHFPQTMATRVWTALLRYATGKGGRPRFKTAGRLRSFEGKSNATGIRWRDGQVCLGNERIRVRFDTKDRWGIEAHALACPVKYLRLVRREIKGKRRWFVQRVLTGAPTIKPHYRPEPNAEPAAFDLGPSTIAVVGEARAFLEPLAPGIGPDAAKTRRLQRALDRSRRATNPDHFHPNGTVKNSARGWVKSTRYRVKVRQLRETERMLAEKRTRAHGQLSNRLVAVSAHIQCEQLSYRAFQKQYGRSVRDRAPGRLVEQLRRKADNAGGGLHEFPTRETALSQRCHCGARKKKPLSERWHRCPCGVGPVQRDLYSAFLGRFVEGTVLDMRRAAAAWPGAHWHLEQAMSRVHKTAIGQALPASVGLQRRQSGSPVQEMAGR